MYSVYPGRNECGAARAFAFLTHANTPRTLDAVYGQARRGHARLPAGGTEVFDYGNNLRQRAFDYGVKQPSISLVLSQRISARFFVRGKAPSAGWPSRGPRRYLQDRSGRARAFPRGRAPAALAGAGPREGAFPGAAIPHLLAGIRPPGPGRAEIQRNGRERELSAPIVIGRDHLDAGSVASPNRETEGDAGWDGRRQRLADLQRPD